MKKLIFLLVIFFTLLSASLTAYNQTDTAKVYTTRPMDDENGDDEEDEDGNGNWGLIGLVGLLGLLGLRPRKVIS